MNSQDRSPRSSRAYHHQIEEALNDSFQRRTLDKFAVVSTERFLKRCLQKQIPIGQKSLILSGTLQSS